MPELTIHLDDELERKLNRLAKRSGRSKSEVAEDAVRRQVNIERLTKLRQLAMPYAAATGHVVDDDLFREAT